ncbi:ubiquinol-cytochrome C reductase [Mytilinidion resinicola]|uniref:Complex III subunit 9 n=1 Tax=Mytilinidion resinicola TaxID=574789 RepID=A0A6A6YG30_9PEZI|nr:ubiquinol-cytochrome C reductase [Mytilinidion resinicola]KAF2807776.1 ubiquinol-cytochrome C reductase [Mytilinidion resinicola]
MPLHFPSNTAGQDEESGRSGSTISNSVAESHSKCYASEHKHIKSVYPACCSKTLFRSLQLIGTSKKPAPSSPERLRFEVDPLLAATPQPHLTPTAIPATPPLRSPQISFEMAGISSGLYNAFFRRNTAMLGAVFFSAFVIEIGFDTGSTKVWDALNRGRQWKDIKQKYMEAAEEEE